MITITTGAPGNGKSLLVQTETVEELAAEYRDVVTSTPVRVLPWVTGDGRGMVGLGHVMRSFFKMEMEEGKIIRPGIVSFGRLLVVEDEEELGKLFLWRRDQVTGEWFKCRWDADMEKFHPEDLKRMGPIYCVTDEAWKCYNSRRWKDTQKVVEFYGRQHRKFGDDWVIVSHSHKDLDVQLNRMAQAWRICTNYGLRRLAVFRQPAYFEVKTFYEAPSSHAARCMHTKITKLNPLLCQTYDTSAGVAVGGGRAADVTRRQKGWHPGWILICAAALILALFAVPRFFSTTVFRLMGRAAANRPPAKAAMARAAAPVSAASTVSTVSANTAKESLTRPNTNYMTGYQVMPILRDGIWRLDLGKRVAVFLADGHVYRKGDGHLQFLCEDFCVVDGITNWYRPPRPSAETVSEPVSLLVGSADVASGSAGSSVVSIPASSEHMSHPAVRDVGLGYSQLH